MITHVNVSSYLVAHHTFAQLLPVHSCSTEQAQVDFRLTSRTWCSMLHAHTWIYWLTLINYSLWEVLANQMDCASSLTI